MTEPNPFTIKRAQSVLEEFSAKWGREFPGAPFLVLVWIDKDGGTMVHGTAHPATAIQALAGAWNFERQQFVAALEQARGRTQ